MADLLNIGTSALGAAQKGLDLTGNNIANVGTPNYSRQRVDQSSRPGSSVNRLDTGGGVIVNGTQRISDALVESRLVRDGAESSRLDTFNGLATRADSLLSDPASGLANSLNDFFSGLSQVAADPTATATRQDALTKASTLTGRFGSLYSEFKSMDGEIDQRLAQSVSTINDLTSSLARINHSISLAGANGAPDLLDQRDQLVQKIAEQVGVTTVPQNDGSLNVFAGSGQSLVVGDRAFALGTVDDLYRPGRVDVSSGGTPVGNQLSGGVIGGLLDARRNLVDPAMEKLGRLAVTISSRVNAVQAQGVTTSGAIGGPLLSTPQATVLAATTNSGSAQATAGFSDLSKLTGDDYLLRNTAGSWQVTRARTGESVAVTGSGTASDPFQFEGLSLSVNGSAASGDSFRISPTHDAASSLRVLTSDPNAIAAAGRLATSASLSNTGRAAISAASVVDGSNGQLTAPATITFTSSSTYQIGAGPSVSFSPGDTISANGWSVTLSGQPATGDRFTVQPTAFGSSDNRNAQALAGLSQEKLLDNGRSTLSAANATLVTQTGATASQVATAKAAADAIKTQTQSQRDAISGVNLDEEAANLVRYQQAYQAAAQVIATANSVFDTLIQATRR